MIARTCRVLQPVVQGPSQINGEYSGHNNVGLRTKNTQMCGHSHLHSHPSVSLDLDVRREKHVSDFQSMCGDEAP
jgi:hypothetical protein